MVKYTKLVLDSGALKGISYIGMLKYFEEIDLLKDISEYVGCSIGAFAALIIIIGYTSDTLMEICNEYNIENLKDFKISTFFELYGFDNGSKLDNFIKVFLKNKNLDENITLKELCKKTNKNLIIVTTNVNTHEAVFINKDTHPDIPVYLAIRMSMNIPLLFHPIKYKDSFYIDGALACGFPTIYYTDTEEEVLCINLKSVKNENGYEIESFDSYLYHVMQSTFHTIYNTNLEHTKKNGFKVIEITCNLKNNLDFNLSISQKKDLYKIGYDCVKKAIEEKN